MKNTTTTKRTEAEIEQLSIEGLLATALKTSRRVAAVLDEELRSDIDPPDYRTIERALRDFASARLSVRLALDSLRRKRREGGQPGGGVKEAPAPGTPEAERRTSRPAVVKDTSSALTALPGGRS